jgi:signal transduction histidine kinase
VLEEDYTLAKWQERANLIKQATAPIMVERVSRRKDGTIVPVEVIVSERNFEGQDYILAVARDISHQTRLEAQLRQAQKLEAVGQLAAGVAHNFNNMLTAIMGYVGLALDNLPANHPVVGDLEGVQKTAQRAANLTHQLLAFTRTQNTQPRLFNLNELIINMKSMLRQLISETIELEILPAPELGWVKIDVGQFEQVLVNMVVNARDAMPEGGELTLATANVTLDTSYTTPYEEIAPGNYVKLSVSDTGCGMTPETKEHIFEPFFTTKEVGKGTGLGLATCFGIVKQSQGHIAVQSEPGQGTTFEIYLPQVEEIIRPFVSPPRVGQIGNKDK